MDGARRPTEDPTAQLSPTARKLVAAARRLLARGGYEALTVEAVAAEAGAYRDSVRYYFGSKAAFIAAVVDSLSHDQSLSAVAETQAAAAGDERVHGLVAGDRRLVDDRAAFRDFFAILPHVVLDDELGRGSRRCTSGTATCTWRASATPPPWTRTGCAPSPRSWWP